MRKLLFLFVIFIVILTFKYYDIQNIDRIPFALTHKFNFIIHGNEARRYAEDVFMTLRIPKIHLNCNIYSFDSELNDVSKNVELLQESDVDKNMFFLAGHSGSGRFSYFNDLSLLEIGDVIKISIDNNDFTYVVDDIYFIDKKGYMDVTFSDNTLFLITCSLIYLDKQLVIRSKLIL